LLRLASSITSLPTLQPLVILSEAKNPLS
jgi:hypothetical protein